jgi:hypothetical protein
MCATVVWRPLPCRARLVRNRSLRTQQRAWAPHPRANFPTEIGCTSWYVVRDAYWSMFHP